MNVLTNLSISRKLTGAFAVVIVIMIGVAAMNYQKLAFIEKSNGWTVHTYAVLEKLHEAMAAMVDQETGVRGYLVAGDTQFLEPYRNGGKAFDRAFAEVKQLTADNPAQQTRLDELRAFADTWRNDVAEKEIALMAAPGTMEQARRMEAGGAGKKSMDGIRGKVAEIEKVERDLLVVRAADQAEAFSASYMLSWIGCLAAALSAGLVAWSLTRGIAAPIVRMTGAMGKLAGGDLKVEIPARDRTDEVGMMAKAMQVFKENMTETERLQAEQRAAEARAAEQEKQREQERVALEKAAAEQRKKELQELADSFERSVGSVIANVTGSAERMQSIAQAMMATAEETSRQSTAVAAASEQASSNVQTVATASEELAASVAEISRQVAQSSQIAQNAVGEAARTNDTVQSLAETANKIGAVVGLIADIASQTNLLALNATIEAARAGEAGKGFAVVASEVKTLANQTAKATEEISGQVSAIQGATENAVGAIKTIGDTIGQINSIATMIASAVEEQGAATREIAENVQQAASGTQEVTSNIAGVSQAASDTGTAANDVLSAAGQLADESAALRREVESFLRTVRAA